VKEHLKSLFETAVLAAAIAVAALLTIATSPPAQAQSEPSTYGYYFPYDATGTNSFGAMRLYTNTTPGSATIINARKFDSIWLQVVGTTTNASGAGSLTVRFAASADGTTYEPTARYVLILPVNGTSSSASLTNINPAPAYLKPISIENISTNSEWGAFKIYWGGRVIRRN
jgi:hypothetical protein